jgi:hypothetical protein
MMMCTYRRAQSYQEHTSGRLMVATIRSGDSTLTSSYDYTVGLSPHSSESTSTFVAWDSRVVVLARSINNPSKSH